MVYHQRTAAATILPQTRETNHSSQAAQHVVVNYTTKEPKHPPRTNDHEGRNAEKWCWRRKRGIQEDVTYHRVSLERIRDTATGSRW